MSSTVKTLLIVGGILAALGVVCVSGLVLAAYFVVDQDAVDRSSADGKEFGKTTDNWGCQAKIVPMMKEIKPTELNKMLNTQYYFSNCLETSQRNPDFCNGVANPFTDIFNDDKAKDAECEKLGLKGSIPCRQVIDEKLDFCFAKPAAK